MINYLRPPQKLFNKSANSLTGYLLTSGIILCGVALAGSIIPFFITTTIPWLLWLSNLSVLVPLVSVSAIIWAAIYGVDLKGILLDVFWNTHYTGDIKHLNPNETFKVMTKYIHLVDKEMSEEHYKATYKQYILKRLVFAYYKDENINTEEKLGELKKYLTHNRSNNLTESEQSVLTYLDSFETQSSPFDERDLDENIIIEELNRLENISKHYPVKTIKNTFDILGWINAFLVNSVGVAISGLSILAFASNQLFALGIISSATISTPLAVFVLASCFGAGVVAAAVLTRVRTKNVGEEIAYSFFSWYESENKLSIFSSKNFSTFVAISVSLIVAIGFAGFNYYTGKYFGSMLVEIFGGNLSNLINPIYILDATSSVSTLGITFALLGFTLTIISTSSFLYGAVKKGLDDSWAFFNKSCTLDNIRDNTFIIEAYVVFIMNLFITFFLFDLPSTNPFILYVGLTSCFVIAPVIIAFSLYIHDNENATKNLFELLGYITITAIIFVMAFSLAAQASIGTSRIGSFWYTYLPAAFATAPLLQVYGAIVFGASMIAFPTVFSAAFADLYEKFNEWMNPTDDLDIYISTDISKFEKPTHNEESFAPGLGCPIAISENKSDVSIVEKLYFEEMDTATPA
jgi:hypothetical protein